MLRLRSELKIVEFAVINFFVSLFSLVVISILSIKFSLEGSIFGMISVLFLGGIFTNKFTLEKPKFFNKKYISNIKNLVFIGFPMMVGAFIQTFTFSLDKLMIFSNYSIEKTGLYSLAAIPILIGISISGIIATYLTPRLLHNFGKDKNKYEIYLYTKKISLTIILIGLILFPFYFFVSDYLLETFFIEYFSIKHLLLFFYFPALIIAADTFGPSLMASKQISFIFWIEIFNLIILLSFYFFISIKQLDLIYFPIALLATLILSFLIRFFYAKQKAIGI